MKELLLNTYQLSLHKGSYYQKKENMSPWKVFSANHFETRDLLWLVFRVHKLCLAKYLYFADNLDEFTPVVFNFDGSIKESNLVKMEALQHKETKLLITITKLQKIRDKNLFILAMEKISGKFFSKN
jgi:hypothetical protein